MVLQWNRKTVLRTAATKSLYSWLKCITKIKTEKENSHTSVLLIKRRKTKFLLIPTPFFHKLLIANSRNCNCSPTGGQLLKGNLRSHWISTQLYDRKPGIALNLNAGVYCLYLDPRETQTASPVNYRTAESDWNTDAAAGLLVSTENKLTVENCFCASVGREKREDIWFTYAWHPCGAGGMEQKDNTRKDY